MTIDQMSIRFKTFAEAECRGSSHLYEYLALRIAEDSDLLHLAAEAPVGQPAPNLLFGAVHFLLLRGRDHSLREYYPSIVEDAKEVQASFPHFKDFCSLYSEEITSILKTKLVQTNEVRRCAYLYPIFCYIYSQVRTPLSLIEIGTSAGLQLLWDQYSYSYGSGELYGNKEATVLLQSEVRQGSEPFLLKESPSVDSRVGFDLHINDVTKNEDALWLKAR